MESFVGIDAAFSSVSHLVEVTDLVSSTLFIWQVEVRAVDSHLNTINQCLRVGGAISVFCTNIGIAWLHLPRPWCLGCLAVCWPQCVFFGVVLVFGIGSFDMDVTFLMVLLVWDGWLWLMLSITSARAADREQRQLAAAQLPILGSALPFILSKEDLLKVTAGQHARRRCLRWVEDIPDVVLSSIDMCFFGGSWFALFDLVLSIAVLCGGCCCTRKPPNRSDDTSHDPPSQAVGAAV